VSYKLWVAGSTLVKICKALSGLLLLALSLIPFQIALHEQGYVFWEWYLPSVLLQIIGGFLLGVPLEVLVNLEKARFRPKEMIIALTITPIATLVFFLVIYRGWYGERALWLLWVLVTSVLLGVAVGRVLNVEEYYLERTTPIPESVKTD